MNDPIDLIQPRRSITGMSAILLPFDGCGQIDWTGFASHLLRTVAAGLTPAVNMDTGYGPLLEPETQRRVLQTTRELIGGQPFLAGTQVIDEPGSPFAADAYQRQMQLIADFGGTPIVFQSYGLAHQHDPEIIENYHRLAGFGHKFYAFELGTMFAEFGRIYSAAVYSEVVRLPACLGAKHSSLNRQLEWDRLRIRNQIRPEFLVLTGNDLAIDMVMYGSDYLLGLSTFCPDLFALRDAFWRDGDPAFYELNDRLQFLGSFAFRHPTSAYKHDAAKFMLQRGWIQSDQVHPKCPLRPDSDDAVLNEIGRQLGLEMRLT